MGLLPSSEKIVNPGNSVTQGQPSIYGLARNVPCLGGDKQLSRPRDANVCVQMLPLSYAPSLTLADFTPNQAHPTSAHRTFSLVDLRDRTPGSKLDVYRSRILQRLKKNQTFFFHWFLESQKRRTRPGRQRILHVPIEVAEKTIKLPSGEVVENGVHVGKIRFRSFGSQEPEKDMLQIEALNEWKNRIVRDRHSEMAIGIVFDFRVYCPEIMVYFGVIMGFKLKKERFRELLKTPRQRPKGRLSKAWWWRENIFSEPGHPLERPSNDPLQIRYANRREAAPPPLMA